MIYGETFEKETSFRESILNKNIIIKRFNGI